MPSYQQDVTLDPGQSAVVTFQHTASVVGVHQVVVDGLSGNFEVLEGVTEVPFDLSVTTVWLRHRTTGPGYDDYNLYATITNIGDVPATHPVAWCTEMRYSGGDWTTCTGQIHSYITLNPDESVEVLLGEVTHIGGYSHRARVRTLKDSTWDDYFVERVISF